MVVVVAVVVVVAAVEVVADADAAVVAVGRVNECQVVDDMDKQVDKHVDLLHYLAR